MRRHLQNNKGYALLLSICVILIFSILGLSLMALTSSGITKNETRENTVQATDLADKGIEFAVGNIQKTLQDQIKLTPMGKTEFEKYLKQTLENTNLQCPAAGQPIPDNIGFKIPGENGSYTRVCIEKIEEIKTNGITEEKDRYKRLVTFRSIGYVNGKEHITRSQVIIGTDAIPDQLKYAVSSNDNGSLFFHGGVEITGDIKSAANVHIIKKAFRGWNNDPTWHTSVALKMNPTSGSSSSKIIFSDESNKLYYYNGNQFNNGKEIVYKSHNNSYNINNQNEIRNILTRSEKVNVLSKNVPEDTINVESKVATIYKDKKYNTTLKGETIKGDTNNLKRLKNSITLVYDEICIKYSNRYPYSCTDYDMTKTKLNIEGNSNSQKNVEIQGTYYINGDVTINYANIKSNAILYVNGDVNIRFSTLNELQNGSSLIIFASGSIFIANISEDLDDPSTIKGFFYSQNNMTLYGVGSNIKIIGGISAKNLYLTALRGKIKNGSYNISEDTQKTSDSRLQIIYDENVIKQYTEFKRDEEEEFITQLNDPETIKRY